jgi:dTDP-4-amino-4,6-dideoxygalactose transaminase
MKSKLALFGGEPVRTQLFPDINTFDDTEKKAINRVIENGRLSGYRGNWCEGFYGGQEIQTLEQAWAKQFGVKHAIACNSATSGLHIACGAIDLTQGDEVIVSPYSMTCSATAPMIYGAVPIFADIEKDYYCIDPVEVEKKITSKTKAIIAVSIFGQPYDPKINEIAKKYNLIVIEDAAQAIGSEYIERDFNNYGNLEYNEKIITPVSTKKHCAGTLGDIGVYSFNYGKHLTCGEGGMIVTDDDELAFKCRLIMNHAEAVVNGMLDSVIPYKKYSHLVGFNMRMTELNAAIIQEQLKKLPDIVKQRRNNVDTLIAEIQDIPAITPSLIRPDCSHSHYVCSFEWDSYKADGIYRDRYIDAVKAELSPRTGRENEDVQIGCGYVKPLYLMPLFNEKYTFGIYPVVENLWANRLFLTLYHAPNSTTDDMQDVAKAFIKVWENRSELMK